jgi:hypothetical protein
MPKRGVGYDKEEVNCLLNAVERVLPIGGYEWDTVFVEHERAYPNRDRTRDGIKRKFNSLHHVHMPTGDPNIPPEVLRAKRIDYKIKKRAEISEGEDNGGFSDDDDEEEDDDAGDDEECNDGNSRGPAAVAASITLMEGSGLTIPTVAIRNDDGTNPTDATASDVPDGNAGLISDSVDGPDNGLEAIAIAAAVSP